MSFPIRTFLILMMLIAIPTSLFAQEPPDSQEAATTATTTTETAAAANPEASETETTTPGEEAAASEERPLTSYEIRHEMGELLRQSPPELASVLRLDPTLLTNDAYLSGYPALASFIETHPEVLRNPRFYLGESQEVRRYNPVGEIIEAMAIFLTFASIALVLAWLVRTIIEQRRWNRLSRTQSEVHNKILDRFGSTEELLAYIKTPAGSKFLESAPIPLHADSSSAKGSPMPRVMLSIQAGVVIAAAGIGFLAVGAYFGEDGTELLALGIIALCVGAGFVASAAVSIFLTRKLDLFQSSIPAPDSETGLMR